MGARGLCAGRWGRSRFSRGFRKSALRQLKADPGATASGTERLSMGAHKGRIASMMFGSATLVRWPIAVSAVGQQRPIDTSPVDRKRPMRPLSHGFSFIAIPLADRLKRTPSVVAVSFMTTPCWFLSTAADPPPATVMPAVTAV